MKRLSHLFFLCGLSACSMPKEVKENQALADELLQDPILQQQDIDFEDYQIHFAARPNPGKVNLVFVHGTPGSWQAFAPYFLSYKLAQEYAIYALDRPGWGKSGYPDALDEFPASLEAQSKLIDPALRELAKQTKQPIILIGHSYGGSLVPKLAYDNSDIVEGMLILAGDLESELARGRWFNQIGGMLPKAIMSNKLYYSNQEVQALSTSLKNLNAKYADLKIPIKVIQGMDDDLVRPQSADYAKELFNKSDLEVIKLEGEGHLIHLTQTELIIDTLLSFADECEIKIQNHKKTTSEITQTGGLVF